MFVTEQQAKDKWCPFSRCSDDYDSSHNRLITEGSNCLGSECMAWREIPGYEGKGFCGLSGTPHMYTDVSR